MIHEKNMYLILRWLINALGLLGIAYLVPGIEVSSFYIALVLVVILGIVNALLGSLIKLLTLPLTILTLGLFNLVVNGLMFWLVSTFIDGFSVSGFWIAVLGALLYTVITTLTGWWLKKED
jgi:putative membrane protein